LLTPHYRFRLEGAGRVFELRLGTLLKDENRRYASVPGHEPVIIVRGATLRMLEYLQGFDTLRLPTVLTFDRDHPDELEVHEKGRKLLYAQRHNDGWADKKLKPLKIDVQRYVDYLVHLRFLRVFDDP